jgi:hypothetical protein
VARFFKPDPGLNNFKSVVATGLWPVDPCAAFHTKKTAHRAVATAAAFYAQGDRHSLGSLRYRSFLFAIKDSRGTKERNVRKCLRKISQLSFLARIVLLGEKPQVVSHIKQALEQFARFFLSTEEVPASNQPERAWEKNTFTPR